MAVGRDERGRRPVLRLRGVAPRTRDAHWPLPPRIVVGELDLPRILRLALAVAEPVVHLELEPGRREHVERGRGDEGVAGQKLATDEPRVRLEDLGQLLGPGLVYRHVAPESAADAAHERLPEVVERPVDRPRRRPRRVRGPQQKLVRSRGEAGVVEVAFAQTGAEAHERENAERAWEAMPPHRAIDGVSTGGQELGEERWQAATPFKSPEPALLAAPRRARRRRC